MQIEKPSNPGAQRLTLTLALADHQPGSQHPDPRPSPSRPAQPCSTSTTFALADQTRHAAALLCLLPSARGRLVPSDQAQVQGHGPRHEVQGSLRPLRRLRQEERTPRLSETAPALSGRSQRHRRTRRPCGWGGWGRSCRQGPLRVAEGAGGRPECSPDRPGSPAELSAPERPRGGATGGAAPCEPAPSCAYLLWLDLLRLHELRPH